MASSLTLLLPELHVLYMKPQTGILFILFTYFVIWPMIRTFRSPVRRVPGPFFARFTRLWELYAMRKYDFASYNLALHEKYGPIVRLGPNRYSINDAEATKRILGHHAPLEKSSYYLPFGSPFATTIFTEPNIAAHAQIKRPFAGLYSNTQLLSYEPFVDTCNGILLKRLKEYTVTQRAFDFRELMQFYAFDVIGEMTVGSRFGFMEDGGDKSGIISAIDAQTLHGALFGIVPELHRLLGYLMKPFNIKPSYIAVQQFVIKQIQDRVSGRTRSPDDRRDFLDKLLPLEQAGKATREHTFQACAGNVFAGSDTTAIALAAAIAYLTMYPTTLAKLRRELEEASSTGQMSNPITFKEAQNLPYLQAVIQEALRIHPSVGAPLVRIVPVPGLTLADQFFPAGTEVGVNPWVLHRNTAVFGPDAHMFRPERWLTSDSEKRSRLDRSLLTFGTGPRVCLGKNITLLEMSKVLPRIVKDFDFEIVADEKTKRGYDWKTYWFTKQNLKCIVRERKV